MRSYPPSKWIMVGIIPPLKNIKKANLPYHPGANWEFNNNSSLTKITVGKNTPWCLSLNLGNRAYKGDVSCVDFSGQTRHTDKDTSNSSRHWRCSSSGSCSANICPTGQQRQGGACIAITCAQHFSLQGNNCIQTSCPQYFSLQAGSCLRTSCPSGQELIATQCFPLCTGALTRLADNSCGCTGGLEAVGTQCLTPCTPPQVRQGTSCGCTGGLEAVGTQCLTPCTPPQVRQGTSCGCTGGLEAVGTQCLTPCTPPQVRQGTGCGCTGGLEAVGTQCLTPCTPPQVRQGTGCGCPSGQELVGSQCLPACTGGRVRQADNTCDCPSDMFFFSQYNQCAHLCINGSHRNPPTDLTCVCPSGRELVNGRCVSVCPSGQVWRGGSCQSLTSCPSGQELVGSRCLPACSSGQVRWGGSCHNLTGCPTHQRPQSGSCVNVTCNRGESRFSGMVATPGLRIIINGGNVFCQTDQTRSCEPGQTPRQIWLAGIVSWGCVNN